MTQGIWQATDHRPVPAAEAGREWALRAYEVLAEIAGRYGRSIEYADLAGEIQRRAGIHTNMDNPLWLDKVLREVSERCAESGKPSLVALVNPAGDASTESSARLSCYQAFGAHIPREKAAPGRAPRARKAARIGEARDVTRAPKRSPKLDERVRPMCPGCFVELPHTGICDSCD